MILGHANLGGQLVAGYNKSRYATEHAKALQKVADYLDEIGSEGTASPPEALGKDP